MLRLLRRHLKTCRQTSTTYRRCQCPIHVAGSIGGVKVRRSLDQSSWEGATKVIRAWEAAGRILEVTEAATLPAAVEAFLHDLEFGQQRKPRRSASTAISSKSDCCRCAKNKGKR